MAGYPYRVQDLAPAAGMARITGTRWPDPSELETSHMYSELFEALEEFSGQTTVITLAEYSKDVTLRKHVFVVILMLTLLRKRKGIAF